MATEKRRTSVGVLFWIAFILLVLVIFLANRSNIESVLETTGIVDVVRDRFSGNGDEGEEIAEDTGQAEEDGAAEGDRQPGDRTVIETDEPSTDPDDAITVTSEPIEVDRQIDEEDETGTPTPESPDTPIVVRATDPGRPNKRMAALYFIKVTSDGRTYPQRVVRAVYYADSPLTETINTLLQGPSAEELGDGLLNLIPEQARLLSAHVNGGVAFLNFNDGFRFNPMGAEGTVAQLQQIIYSSTEFATVTQVQFLIEGEQVEYLGGEGIYVGKPLGRDAFS